MPVIKPVLLRKRGGPAPRVGRRGFLTGGISALAAPALIRSSKAATITVQQPSDMNGHAIDPNSILWMWPGLNGGDEGTPIEAWAWPRFAYQLTGWNNNNRNNPITPVQADRAVELQGSLDDDCWVSLGTIAADPAGMASKKADPWRVSATDAAFRWVKPVVHGTLNQLGPDCSLLLFVGRKWDAYGK